MYTILLYLLCLNSIVPCINLFIDLLIYYLFRIFLNEANNCSHASREPRRLNYYLNILWFLFKCAIFTYNCTDLFASCAATPSLRSIASLCLTFQNLMTVSC